jgi:hypothetical protein
MPARTYHGWLQIAAAVAVALCFPADLPAQTIISVRAGLLNHTEGCVLLDGEYIEAAPTRLVHLVPGRHLRTENGNAEIMLGPEIFLRLGFESGAEMISTDLAAPQVRLWGGSAMIDANGLTDRNPVSVLVGDAELRLVKKGLYRVDMPLDGSPAVTVFNGRALVVAENRKKAIQQKHTVELAGNSKHLVVRRLEPARKDALDDWSRERASAIADVNGELLRKQVEQDRQEKDLRVTDKLGIWGP